MLRDLRLTLRLFRQNVLFVLLFLIEILLAFMLIFASYNRYTEKKTPWILLLLIRSYAAASSPLHEVLRWKMMRQCPTLHFVL